MSIKKNTSSEPIKIVSSFIPKILFHEIEVQQLRIGHIHESYLIQYSGIPTWILQRINIKVFSKPERVEKNHQILIQLFKKESIKTLKIQLPEIVPYSPESLYYWDANHQPWRLYTFYNEHVCYEYCPSLEIARNAGRAFGQFSKVLNQQDDNQRNKLERKHDLMRKENLRENSLHTKTNLANELFKPTLEAFHSIHQRAHQHHAAWARYHGPLHLSTQQESQKLRFDLVAWNINIEKYLPIFLSMEDALTSEDGSSFAQLSHNDAKLNNLLIHPENKSAIILDLDTVMPGSLLFDLGDGLRSIATSTKEDELDLIEVCINWEYYQQYQDSFLSEVSSFITEIDQRYMPLACSYMTFIMGLRFYTDYLNGNRYYSCNYPEHNLVRARNQFHLLHQIMEEMNG
tara:strand:+ start:1600 stop:2805 length:1206 start_codon:yes stop_codon:yes gene_type:complete